jgi:hypothetical protein
MKIHHTTTIVEKSLLINTYQLNLTITHGNNDFTQIVKQEYKNQPIEIQDLEKDISYLYEILHYQYHSEFPCQQQEEMESLLEKLDAKYQYPKYYIDEVIANFIIEDKFSHGTFAKIKNISVIYYNNEGTPFETEIELDSGFKVKNLSF